MAATRSAGVHLSPDRQAAALAEWGRPGNFRCCVCGDDVKVLGGTVATRSGFGMAACVPCDTRMAHSPKFRRRALRLADSAALRTLLQRVADLAGVTGPALLQALPLAGLADPAAVQRAENTLRLPPGSIAGALAQVLGAGVRQ